jgi:hypothetical protein
MYSMAGMVATSRHYCAPSIVPRSESCFYNNNARFDDDLMLAMLHAAEWLNAPAGA